MMNITRNMFFGMIAAMMVLAGSAGPAAAAAPKPPAGKVEIKGCQKKKPPVNFDHAKHVAGVKKMKEDCATCHHAVKGKPATEHKCTSCHMKAQGKIGTCQEISPTKNPMHIKCIGCHKKMAATAKDAPTKCAQCHGK